MIGIGAGSGSGAGSSAGAPPFAVGVGFEMTDVISVCDCTFAITSRLLMGRISAPLTEMITHPASTRVFNASSCPPRTTVLISIPSPRFGALNVMPSPFSLSSVTCTVPSSRSNDFAGASVFSILNVTMFLDCTAFITANLSMVRISWPLTPITTSPVTTVASECLLNDPTCPSRWTDLTFIPTLFVGTPSAIPIPALLSRVSSINPSRDILIPTASSMSPKNVAPSSAGSSFPVCSTDMLTSTSSPEFWYSMFAFAPIWRLTLIILQDGGCDSRSGPCGFSFFKICGNVNVIVPIRSSAVNRS